MQHIVIADLVKENTISILWMIPQYFVITAGEIMFSVTGLEFAYSQAPSSMKSVVQAAWLLTTAIGNFVVVLITAAIKLEKEVELIKFSKNFTIKSNWPIFNTYYLFSVFHQSYNAFFYAGLMFADMILFWWLARNYKYQKQAENSLTEDTPDEKRKSSIQ